MEVFTVTSAIWPYMTWMGIPTSLDTYSGYCWLERIVKNPSETPRKQRTVECSACLSHDACVYSVHLAGVSLHVSLKRCPSSVVFRTTIPTSGIAIKPLSMTKKAS